MSRACENQYPQHITFDGTKLVYWKCDDCGASWSRTLGDSRAGWAWNGGMIIEHSRKIVEALAENDPMDIILRSDIDGTD